MMGLTIHEILRRASKAMTEEERETQAYLIARWRKENEPDTLTDALLPMVLLLAILLLWII